jgi:hypothetical protein
MTSAPAAVTIGSMAIDRRSAPHRRRLPTRPGSRAGARAAVLALVAVAALTVSAGLTAAFDRGEPSTRLSDVMLLVRAAVIVVFWAAGAGALALSVHSLRRGDRSVSVWAALAVGVAATLLLVAELTVLE